MTWHYSGAHACPRWIAAGFGWVCGGIDDSIQVWKPVVESAWPSLAPVLHLARVLASRRVSLSIATMARSGFVNFDLESMCAFALSITPQVLVVRGASSV